MNERAADETILQQPFDRGVRLVALSLIDDAQKAADNLTEHAGDLRNGSAEGDEALHDFRVAVRRVRSWLGAFKPWLKNDVSRKKRRNLSRTAEATRETRDAAVHLEWLRKERPVLNGRQRVGQSWLTDRFERQREEGCDTALTAAAEFSTLSSALTRKLSYYHAPVREADTSDRFGAVFEEHLTAQSDKLRKRLGRVHEFTDASEAHRARIAAKNLRYVAEPIVRLVGRGDEMIRALKKLQDSLGELHDVHVFAEELVAATEKAAGSRARRVSEVVLTADADESEVDRVRRARARDPGPGLLGLARLLHERGMQIFADIERDWLEDGGEALFEQVEKFAADLSERESVDREIEPVRTDSLESPRRAERILDREVPRASDYADTSLVKSNGDEAPAQEAREDARI